MDDNILVCCKYSSETVVLRISIHSMIDDVLHGVCNNWNGLSVNCVVLSYVIPGHPICALQNDHNMRNMFLITRSVQLNFVDVTVGVKGNEVHDFEGGEVVESSELTVDPIGREDDLLPSFCSHNEKVLLTDGWSNGIVDVGQKFEGGVVNFRNALCKYAIEVDFQFNYVKNEKTRVKAECVMKYFAGCEWFIVATLQRINGWFYIKKLNNEHTCGVAARTTKNKRLTSNLVGGLIVDNVRQKPDTRPVDVKSMFHTDYGLTISYDQAWMNVEKARGMLFGDHSLSYQQLRWYVQAASKSNPGSYFVLEGDSDTQRFSRLFMSFKACIHGFKYCRSILFIDGTFLKGMYKGIILSATAKDGNQGLFPLAFAVVDSENECNWRWFLEQLAEIVDNTRDLTIMSDRNVGLMETMPKVFPTVHHSFCLQHLKANLRDKYSGGRFTHMFRERMVFLFTLCAYAPTEAFFNEKLDAFRHEGGAVADKFLENLPFEKWSNAFFQGKRYGEMSSNAAESFNAWITKSRHLPIISMIDTIKGQIMNQMGCRLNISLQWNDINCPNIETKLQAAFSECHSWFVRVSSSHVFEVNSHPSVTVDIDSCKCSCHQWQINGLPCAHAVAVIQKSGRNINEFVDYFYQVSTYRLCYSQPIHPILTLGRPEFSAVDVDMLPPLSKKQPGRPRKRRFRSKGELVRKIHCGRCGRLGSHNKKTCNELL